MTKKRPRTALDNFGPIFDPSEAEEPILAKPVRGALLEWLTEIWAGEDLAQVGLKARRKALFTGPPGVGKTTLAHHLAARLGLPMLAIRPERIVDRWVGAAERNIGLLFDAAVAEPEPEPIVLFLDEFESLARTRRAPDQAADDGRNSMVNTLLARIEVFDGFVIAATNAAGEIDPAMWRRFEMHIAIELPGQDERERILARYLAPHGLGRAPLAELARAFETAAPALMRQFCEGLKRQIVIGPKVGWNMDRDATLGRLIASVSPHPELGKPRLWSLGVEDPAVRALPWPLPLARDIPAGQGPLLPVKGAAQASGGKVVEFGGRSRAP